MDDLTTRLRAYRKWVGTDEGLIPVPSTYCHPLMEEAADRIDALTARVAELEAALKPALHDALDLLTLGADSLRECSTRDEAGTDWTGEPEAQAEYERTLRTVEALKRAAALLSPKEPPA